MNYILENDLLKVSINSLGAEVKSIVRKNNGKEIWWTGNKQYWEGSSPILFPACGGLWNGEYSLEGTTYKMPKHGFVKSMEWQMIEDSEEGRLTFCVADTEETRRYYPFSFKLFVSYVLDGESLQCLIRVDNNESARMMPFQIGGHPAVALPYFSEDVETVGYVRPLFNEKKIDAQCLTVVRAGEQGCWSRERHEVNCNVDGLIPVSEQTFANEALIFDHKQITGAEILDLHKNVLARVSSYAPVWLFWQQQNRLCPFICAEPWYGLCDLQLHSTELIERPYSQCVAPKASAYYVLWRIEFPS